MPTQSGRRLDGEISRPRSCPPDGPRSEAHPIKSNNERKRRPRLGATNLSRHRRSIPKWSTMNQIFQSRFFLTLAVVTLVVTNITATTSCLSTQLPTSLVANNADYGIDLSITNGQQRLQPKHNSSTNQQIDIASDERLTSMDPPRSGQLTANSTTGASITSGGQQLLRRLADSELDNETISAQPSQLMASTMTELAPYRVQSGVEEELLAADSKKKKKMMKKKKKMEKKHKEWKKGKKHKKVG